VYTGGHASPGARHRALDRIAPHGGARPSRFPQGEPYYPVRGRSQLEDSALRRPGTGTHLEVVRHMQAHQQQIVSKCHRARCLGEATGRRSACAALAAAL